MSGIVEAVKGEGRTGRVGLVSILKDRINDKESGIGVAPLALNGEPPGPRFRLILDVCMWVCNYVYAYMFKPKVASPPTLMRLFHGLSAVVPVGLPEGRPGLQMILEGVVAVPNPLSKCGSEI
jgi:hypothetical protein